VTTEHDGSPTVPGDLDGDGGVSSSEGGVRRVRRWCKAHWARVVVVVAFVGAVALTATLFLYQYRPDHQSDAAQAQPAIQAASDGTVAVLSYSPESIDRDIGAAKAHLTGDFLSYYGEFTERIVLPAAAKEGVSTSATVVRAAVSELHPDDAVVLVFVNQSTTRKKATEPALSSSSVAVTLTKVRGSWLISKFNPI
jgi:Mce-associated membrane protein